MEFLSVKGDVLARREKDAAVFAECGKCRSCKSNVLPCTDEENPLIALDGDPCGRIQYVLMGELLCRALYGDVVLCIKDNLLVADNRTTYVNVIRGCQPEILLTILSSLSQEEARSISENVTWGLRKRFADGKFSVGYSRFLGYDKGEDGNLAINEEQAKIVRLIFRLFLERMTACRIAKELAARHILTVTGKERWNAKTIQGVLANEKYTGCARIQKTFTPDFLTKKAVKNCGQVPSYFVEQSHPVIIDPAVFEIVQREMERRTREGGRYSGVSIFSGKIRCSACGGSFGGECTI